MEYLIGSLLQPNPPDWNWLSRRQGYLFQMASAEAGGALCPKRAPRPRWRHPGCLRGLIFHSSNQPHLVEIVFRSIICSNFAAILGWIYKQKVIISKRRISWTFSRLVTTYRSSIYRAVLQKTVCAAQPLVTILLTMHLYQRLARFLDRPLFPWKRLILGFSFGQFAFESLLNWRQYRVLQRTQTPKVLSTVVKKETYDKSQVWYQNLTLFVL